MLPTRPWSLRLCLLTAAAALLVVGAVSHTLVRHLVQIVPLVAVACLPLDRAWATGAALGVLIHWIGIMVLIWLYLAHVSNIAGGDYTPAEVAMTVVVAAAGAVGVARALPGARGATGVAGALLLVGFAAQFAFLYASYSLVH